MDLEGGSATINGVTVTNANSGILVQGANATIRDYVARDSAIGVWGSGARRLSGDESVSKDELGARWALARRRLTTARRAGFLLDRGAS